MSEGIYLAPPNILQDAIDKSILKANAPAWKQALLAVLGGAFIAFAASSSNMAAYGFFADPQLFGFGKFIAGIVFPVGLMLIVLGGGELFTGNSLLSVAVYEKKLRPSLMLKNWLIVYLGNFAGSLLIVYFTLASGQLKAGTNLLGGITVKIAAGKVSLGFTQAVILGIMCNWIVCIAVWISYGAKDMTGKIFAMFFPIFLFVIAGFEHSIANMYYIPAGILAKATPEFAEVSKLSLAALSNLTWSNFFIKNLLPVTIGNIIGGTFFVGFIYWICYRKKSA